MKNKIDFGIFCCPGEIADAAATLILERLKAKPDLVLGLATGSSPEMTYELLSEDRQENSTDWSKVRTFNLDEYIGLKPEHEQSYHAFMQQHLFKNLNVKAENIHLPDGMNATESALKQYEAAISTCGGIDLQILGLGVNGHIAFNEPGSSFKGRTHIQDLAESTIAANTRFFASASEVPRRAVTMGIGTIMEAKEIVVIAFGENKAEAVAAMLTGTIDESWPCSILRTHPKLHVFIDEEAASKVKLAK